MCNLVYVSTNSSENLQELSCSDFILRPVNESDDSETVSILAYPNRWYLESRFGGCSCHYLHVIRGGNTVFEPPPEWMNMDADDMASTQAVYRVLRRLVDEGFEVDVVDVWNYSSPEDIKTITLSVKDVPEESFWFFEGYRFELVP